jgi:TRAP-type C4-dicarboxylate transport system permease small subunit
MNNINLGQLVSQITGIIQQVVSIGLLLLILAAVAARYGFRVPILPATDPTALAWLCGAVWLYRGGKL